MFTRSQSRTEINHLHLFTFGFLFYWVLPLLVHPEGANFVAYLAPVSDEKIISTLLIMFGIYGCFLTGDRVGFIIRYQRRETSPLLGCRPLLYLASLATFVFVLNGRNQLFVEYADNTTRGTLTAFVLLIFAIALSRASSRNEALIKNRYFLAFSVCCLLLLYLGQRMTVVGTCIALLVYKTCYFGKVSKTKLIVWFVLGLLLVAFVGIIRVGTELSLLELGGNLISEPLGTAISLFDFLSSRESPLLSLPFPLLSRFSNLLPSVVVGDKQALVEAWRDGISSPFGSFNAYVSWMLNFGILGSFVFAGLVGFFFRWMRQKETSFTRVVYSLLCGWLAFSFFRDDFGISIVKSMFEDSFMFPVIIFAVSGIVTKACKAFPSVHRFPNTRFAPIGSYPKLTWLPRWQFRPN